MEVKGLVEARREGSTFCLLGRSCSAFQWTRGLREGGHGIGRGYMHGQSDIEAEQRARPVNSW